MKEPRIFNCSIQRENLLYEQVIERSKKWRNADRLMYVVGATKAKALQKIRTLIPDSILVDSRCREPKEEVWRRWLVNGLNDTCGLLVNSSRGILFTLLTGSDFDQVAGECGQMAYRNKWLFTSIKKGLYNVALQYL